MTVLPGTPDLAVPDLEAVAARLVWFKPPAEALRNPWHFLAYFFAYGTPEDTRTIRRHVSDNTLREALDHAPPGIIDPRSWAYWNLILDRDPDTQPPTRRF
ncbi:hypothetical protein [Ferrovibrio sp.]|uniref:hypothetical protein n=1 Tax=Ferrovibrio sp. TaxID=1917215 RepID=UPI0025BAEA97|nr:hypothetical protein [Ferrovibrio sp.]MBX3456518.1 hypothetical protein [Ferrovibrio sp.]